MTKTSRRTALAGLSAGAAEHAGRGTAFAQSINLTYLSPAAPMACAWPRNW